MKRLNINELGGGQRELVRTLRGDEIIAISRRFLAVRGAVLYHRPHAANQLHEAILAFGCINDGEPYPTYIDILNGLAVPGDIDWDRDSGSVVTELCENLVDLAYAVLSENHDGQDLYFAMLVAHYNRLVH